MQVTGSRGGRRDQHAGRRRSFQWTQSVLRLVLVLLLVLWSVGYVFLTLLTSLPTLQTPTPSPQPDVLSAMDEFVDRKIICDRIQRGVLDVRDLNTSVQDACRRWLVAQSEYFRARPQPLNTFGRRLLRTGDSICSNRTFLVVLIHSLHTHADRRAAIRNTWGGAAVSGTWPDSLSRRQMPEVRLAFIFGRLTTVAGAEDALGAESDQYGDLVQGNFEESYRNMTLKSLTGLDWVIRYCSSAEFMFKCDDDMFVNIPGIINAVRSEDMRGAIMGPYNAGSRVYRKGKWALAPTEYPFYYFPPYESGSGYVISADLLRPLRNASDYVPYIFIDDVYVTGILGRVVGARHVTRPGFAYWTNKPPSACAILNGSVLTGTRVTPAKQGEIWSNLVSRVNCTSSSSRAKNETR